jgi:hypothetical protein
MVKSLLVLISLSLYGMGQANQIYAATFPIEFVALNGTELEYRNTGTKPISGVIIQNTVKKPPEQIIQDYPSAPLDPEQTRTISGLDPRTTLKTLSVSGVIFDDNSYLGNPVNFYYGNRSAIDQIFELRTGQAASAGTWAQYYNHLSSDPHKAVQDFLSETKDLPDPPAAAHSEQEAAKIRVEAAIKKQAADMDQALKSGAHDESWAYQQLLQTRDDLQARALSYHKFATRGEEVKQ